MKALLTTVGIGLLVGAFYLTSGNSSHPVSEKLPVAPTGSPLITTDGATVFQRAFWKRPTPADVIHNAERREWADDRGVSRWQWFIELSPSSQLEDHLFERNSFALIEKNERFDFPPDRPAWFPPSSSGFRVLSSRSDDMVILYDRQSDRLFASGIGKGFSQAVATPSIPIVQQSAVSSGRLPNASPPAPNQR